MNKVIKLSGDFSRSHAVQAACEAVEIAQRERDCQEYGSTEWHELNDILKAAKREHGAAIKALRS